MAFGNPYISTNPISENLYSSQADTYGNSFTNPMNIANMNSGMGINSSLLTPSYTANYRPQYSGPQPHNEYGRQGFFKGLSRLSPTSPDVIWGNPFMHQQQSIEAVAGRPADATMWGVQRIVAPALAFGVAQTFASTGWRAGSAIGKGIGSGIATGFGAVEGAAGIGGAVNALSRGVMGGAGGVAGYLGAPLLIGQAAMWGAEKGIFNPYVNTRASAKNLRDNFSGITFGDSTGNSITGGGLGFRESTNMAQQITHQGISDMTFSAGQYRQGADMIGRAGLMDNVTAKGITKRIKESMEQVKLIMSVAAMPEMRDAIEQLSKLQQSGASITGGVHSTAASTMRQIGGLASQAGMSVQHMMNTVGAQGQYLYQANGMTPYLGQLAAGAAVSAFSAGNRMGLISPAQLARMGGVEGATQASLTGQINVSQTLFNQMGLHNQYLGKNGSSDDMLSTVQKFSNSMVSDPLGTYGSMKLHGRQMAGKQMEERGSLAVEDQLMSIAKNMPGLIDTKTGKLSAEKAVPLLMQMGMSMDSIDAFFQQRISETDEGSFKLRGKAIDKNLIEQQTQVISQDSTYGGVFGTPVRVAMKLGRGLTNYAAQEITDPITAKVGSAGDAIQNITHKLWFGNTLGAGDSGTFNELMGIKEAKVDNSNLQVFDENSLGINSQFSKKASNKGNTQHTDAAYALTSLAKSGNSDAVGYFSAKTSEEKQKYLRSLIKSGSLSKDYADPATLDKLSTFLDSAKKTAMGKDDEAMISGKTANSVSRGIASVLLSNPLTAPLGALALGVSGNEKVDPSDKAAMFNDSINKASGMKGGDVLENLQTLGLAQTIAQKMAGDPDYALDIDKHMETDLDLQKLSKITGKTGSALLQHAQQSNRTSLNYGLGGLAKVAKDTDLSKYSDKTEAFKALYDANGGVFIRGAAKNADGLTDQEVANQQAVNIEGGKAHNTNNTRNSTRLALDNINKAKGAVDMGPHVKKFGDAVQKFADIVNKEGGSTFMGSTTLGTMTNNPAANWLKHKFIK